jgi:hypothetical protein
MRFKRHVSGVGLSPLGTAATSGLLYKSQMIDEGDCGATGGMKLGRGNRSTRRKPAPAPLCPQIPHDQTRAQTRAAAVGSQRLTAWAMARPHKRHVTQGPKYVIFDGISQSINLRTSVSFYMLHGLWYRGYAALKECSPPKLLSNLLSSSYHAARFKTRKTGTH